MSKWRGLLTGVVAASAGLAASEFVTALAPNGVSLVTAVGDEVIARTPNPLRQDLIELLGARDKPLLVSGTVVLVLLAGGLAGMAPDVRRRPLLAGAAVLALLGGLAAGNGPLGSPVAAGTASVTAVLGATCALRVLDGRWPLLFDRVPAGHTTDLSRRRFLRRMIVVLALAELTVGASAVLRDRAAGPLEAFRRRLRLPVVRQPLASPPAATQVSGLAPVLTPNADFYRVDVALVVPRVDPRTWSLHLTGRVRTAVNLTYDDLLAMPQVEADITLTCVGNLVGGDLVSTARWQGVLLRDLLALVGPDDSADQVVGRSVDDFTCGFPLSVATDGRTAMVALGMNGEPLPFEHGFPARLVVPGLFGYASATKWLREIELSTFDDFDAYYVRQGWERPSAILTQSRIDVPRSGARIPPGHQMVAGVAWAQHRGIRRVEISVDDGPWQQADLAGELSVDTWRLWSWQWDATPGPHTLKVRATDGDGQVQSIARRQPFPRGASGWHVIPIEVG